jgi:LPS sulfotransferase NodH
MTSVSKQIVRAYLICAAPRTGSTLLQEALYYSYIAGNPLEYFGLTEEHWLRELRQEPTGTGSRTLQEGATDAARLCRGA